jgi:hypothetical protein
LVDEYLSSSFHSIVDRDARGVFFSDTVDLSSPDALSDPAILSRVCDRVQASPEIDDRTDPKFSGDEARTVRGLMLKEDLGEWSSWLQLVTPIQRASIDRVESASDSLQMDRPRVRKSRSLASLNEDEVWRQV